MSSGKKSRKGGMRRGNQSFSGGFPDSMRTRLRWVSPVYGGSIVTTTGVYRNFRGNGPWDPDQTGTGDQPYNWDDWAVQYQRYRCYGSQIRVIVMSSGTTYLAMTSRMMLFAERTAVTIDTDAEWRDAASSPYAKWWFEASNLNSSFHTEGVHMAMSTAKIFGQDAAEFRGSDDNAAVTSTVPAEEWYWTVAFHNLDGSTTVPLHYMVEISYDVEFFERVVQTIDAMERIVKAHRGNGGGLRDPKVRMERRARERKEKEDSETAESDSSPALPRIPLLGDRKERKQN